MSAIRHINFDAKGRKFFRCECGYQITENVGINKIIRNTEIECPSCHIFWQIYKKPVFVLK